MSLLILFNDEKENPKPVGLLLLCLIFLCRFFMLAQPFYSKFFIKLLVEITFFMLAFWMVDIGEYIQLRSLLFNLHFISSHHLCTLSFHVWQDVKMFGDSTGVSVEEKGHLIYSIVFG
jgi:hypothetical protein